MSGGHGPHRIKVMNIKDFKRVLRSPDVDYDGIVSLTGKICLSHFFTLIELDQD